MAFGPESNNPRELRAYAHAMIGKLATGDVNYGEALSAAYHASRTAKGSRSGFEDALRAAAHKLNATQETQAVSGYRALRRVPLNWQHPKNASGQHIPLFDSQSATDRYTIADLAEMIERGDYAAADVDPKSWFMPTFNEVPAEEMGLCLYETTTEGTPLTPVFPDTETGHKDLAASAAEHASLFADKQASAESWEQLLFGKAEQKTT